MLKGNWKKKNLYCGNVFGATREVWMIQTTKFDVSTSFYPLCIVQGFCFLFFFLKVLCVWIVPSTLENLSRFVLPCHLVVKLNWWNSIKNFWAWLHASSVVAGCLKLSIYLHPLIHFSVLGQGLEPIPAVIQQDAEYTLHRSPTPIYCKWDDSVNNCTKMLLSTFKPQI